MAIRKLATDFVALTANTNETIDEIATLANGSIVVTSHRSSSTGALKYSTRLYDSTYVLIGSPQNLNASNYASFTAAKGTKVLDLGDGTFWVLWNAPPQAGATAPTVMSQHFAADGSKIGAATLQSIFDGHSKSVSASIAASGDPLKPLEWASVKTENGTTSITLSALGANFASLGSDITLTGTLAVDTTITGVKAIAPDRFLVSFVENKSTATTDKLSFAIADLTGGAFANPTLVRTGTINDAEIDVNPNGTFAVTWREAYASAPNGVRIMVKVFAANGDLLGTADHITRNEAVYGRDYETVVLDNGRIATMWVTADHADPKKTVLFLQYFEAQGEAATNEILLGYVPRQTAGINLHAELNAAGKLVVNWIGLDGTTLVKKSAAFDPYKFVATSADDGWTGSDANETLRGANGHDELRGLGGRDQLYGDAGDDKLLGGAGADRLDGGVGRDTASYYYDDAITASLLTPAIATGAAQGDTYVSIENLEGSNNGNDILEGNRINNELYGLKGNDSLYGGDGNDYLLGGAGADSLEGGNGIDFASYFFDTAVTASLRGTAGKGAAAGDVFVSIENLQGSRSGSDHLTGDGENNKLFGLGGNDILDGFYGNDDIFGGDGADRLVGNFGSDQLDGGAGNDRLYGGIDDDKMFGGSGVDYFSGGTGFDYVDFDGSASVVVSLSGKFANAGAAKGETFVGIEGVFGTHKGADKIGGNSVKNTLFGFGGDDKLYGEGGDDDLLGGAGKDLLDGGAGSDMADYYNDAAVTVALDGSVTNKGAAAGDKFVSIEELGGSNRFADLLIGDAGKNYLSGSGGNDTLKGRAGVDGLRGGLGNDILDGESGSDYYVYYNINESNDKIVNFEKGEYFSFPISMAPKLTDYEPSFLNPAHFQSGSTNISLGEFKIFIFRTTDDTLWRDVDGKGGAASVLIADLQNDYNLTADNIWLF